MAEKQECGRPSWSLPATRSFVIGNRDDRRVNHRIRARSVLVIDEKGEQLGEMSPQEAVDIAQERELDLVEVSPNSRPPVCRIMDYGKFKYQQTKRQAQAKKKQKTQQVKEVKFRVKTDDHDYNFKLDHIRRFLGGGDKAKVTIMFRGREMTHQELGLKIIEKVIEDLKEEASVEQRAKLEGRNMFAILAPLGETAKKKIDKDKAKSAPAPKAAAQSAE